MKETKKNLVAIKGGKNQGDKEDIAILRVDGEVVELESFVIAGETPEGKRTVINWNTSADQLLRYGKIVDIVVYQSLAPLILPED